MIRLETLKDHDATVSRMMKKGLTREAADDKSVCFARAAGALTAAGAPADAFARAYYVPGRIEVLGKHTDYPGGRSIVLATNRGLCLVARTSEDARTRVTAADTGESSAFELHPDLVPRHGHWTNYPMTVARRVSRNFGAPLRGVDVAFSGDLPPAAGMSSSSAMIVAFFFALSGANDLWKRPAYRDNIHNREDQAEYLGCVENGQTFRSLVGDKGVGTFGGSEDHTAIICGKPGALVQYSYCPVRHERDLPSPEGWVFAVARSGVMAEKTGDAQERFNRVSRRATAATEVWNRKTGRNDPHLAAIVASGPDAAERLRETLANASWEDITSEELRTRFEQFHAESEEILPLAGDALDMGDLEAFGAQVDRSQELAETLLGNQTPETVFLARAARESGAAAASSFGAGFGGSVWALVRAERADAFLGEWSRRYADAFPEVARNAGFFLANAGPSAFKLD